MTGTARARRHITAEKDLQRLVNRMALGTGCRSLSGSMRFVTGETGRFEAVRCVARHTGNLRVLARVCDKLLTDGSMAVEAIVCKQGGRGDLLRGMRICMTPAAFNNLRPVRSFMAGGALGHDRIKIPLTRAIGVQEVMAALTGETVSSAVILDVLKWSCVALCA